VESINIRTTLLRDLGGVVHIFNNGNIQSLSNMTKEWSAMLFDIGVAYKEDPDRVIGIMAQVAGGMRGDPAFGPMMIENMEVLGIEAFADSSVIIKARQKTAPMKQWDFGREYRKRLKKAFDQAGIEMPFPHMSVYFGEASRPFKVDQVQPHA
jgi:small conductance mechanosensitive channel